MLSLHARSFRSRSRILWHSMKKKKGNRSIVFNMNTHVSVLLVSFKDRNNGIFPIQMTISQARITGYWLIVKQELSATATNLIITTPRTSCIYFLPKIHKPNNPGRPIVSACSCPTELISSYLDKIMAPIVKSLPSYIKDSEHALEIFRDFNFLGQDKLIFTMDISSLYTVIPNSEGLVALKYFLRSTHC